jgi:hypothetical protein
MQNLLAALPCRFCFTSLLALLILLVMTVLPCLFKLLLPRLNLNACCFAGDRASLACSCHRSKRTLPAAGCGSCSCSKVSVDCLLITSLVRPAVVGPFLSVLALAHGLTSCNAATIGTQVQLNSKNRVFGDRWTHVAFQFAKGNVRMWIDGERCRTVVLPCWQLLASSLV